MSMIENGNLNGSVSYEGKEAVMAKYLIGLIMAAVMAVILGISTSASAGLCELRCNTSSVTDDELKDCLKKCQPSERYCKCLKKKVSISNWTRRKCITACSDGPDMVNCPSANDGAGDEIKSGGECKPCSELDSAAVESEDGTYCVKHCPLFRQAVPLLKWTDSCPTCESIGYELSGDGKNCVEKMVERITVPVAAPVNTCEDCKGCDFFCITVWDILLFILFVLVCVYLFMDHRDRKKSLRDMNKNNQTHLKNVSDQFEAFKTNVEALLGQSVSGNDLGLILIAQRVLIALGDDLTQLESAKNEASSSKIGIEDELVELKQKRSQLETKSEEARRNLETAEATGPKKAEMKEMMLLMNTHKDDPDKAQEAFDGLQAEYNANFETALEPFRQIVVDAEATLAVHEETKKSLEVDLEKAETACAQVDKAFDETGGQIEEIYLQHPVLAPSPQSGGGTPDPSA